MDNDILKQILLELKEIKETQNNHTLDLSAIKNITMENSRFINALSQDVARTATKDSITTLSASIEVLNTRLFQQETKIVALSIAK